MVIQRYTRKEIDSLCERLTAQGLGRLYEAQGKDMVAAASIIQAFLLIADSQTVLETDVPLPQVWA